MLKKVELGLSQIKYKGKSIGDDIRIEVEILDKFIRIDKNIKAGTTVKLDKEIGSITTDQKSTTTNVKITIIEKDILFNNVGNIEKFIKVDVNSPKPQEFVYEIELKETHSIFGKLWGKSVAIFEVTIEARILDVIKYIPDENNGWLNVKFSDNRTIPLPQCLKLKLDRIERGREYLTILEGAYRGQAASVKLKDNGDSYLSTDIQHESMARLKYSISKRKLIIGNDEYQATDHADSPWEKGLYDIEIPDYPHEDRRNYVKISSRFKTWFRIGHNGERYLHTGRASLGCITITEIEKWNEIYNKLIKARKGDSASIGVLEVVD